MSLVFILVAALSAQPAPNDALLDPTQAMRQADAAPNRRDRITCAFTVVSAQRTLRGVYLHSTDDYRRPDDLTVRLSFPVADGLARRLGSPPEQALVGKRVVVRGVVELIPIANTFAGRPRGLNRVEHEIVAALSTQIVAID